MALEYHEYPFGSNESIPSKSTSIFHHITQKSSKAPFLHTHSPDNQKKAKLENNNRKTIPTVKKECSQNESLTMRRDSSAEYENEHTKKKLFLAHQHKRGEREGRNHMTIQISFIFTSTSKSVREKLENGKLEAVL